MQVATLPVMQAQYHTPKRTPKSSRPQRPKQNKSPTVHATSLANNMPVASSFYAGGSYAAAPEPHQLPQPPLEWLAPSPNLACGAQNSPDLRALLKIPASNV
jgi:hypothetical protein